MKSNEIQEIVNLTVKMILELQKEIQSRDEAVRKLQGGGLGAIENALTGETDSAISILKQLKSHPKIEPENNSGKS